MKLHELLTDESKWTQHVLARDIEGVPTPCMGEYAVCWCLYGAIRVCYPEDFPLINLRIARVIGTAVGPWNDSHSFAEVRQLILDLDL